MSKGNYLGEVASLVLTVIGVAEETNAIELTEVLSEAIGKKVYAGVLYNTLKRLEDEKFLKSQKKALKRVDTRVRNTYKLSAKGRKRFRKEQETRERLKAVIATRFEKTIH